MERFKYRAINSKGRPVRGVIAAANEVDLYNQLQAAKMELLQCAPLTKKKGALAGVAFLAKVKIRDLVQFFLHMEQMQSAGVPLLDALGDIRDTTDNNTLRDIMSEIHRDVSEGSSLSEAMSQHPKVFNALYVSLIASGEETGDMTSSYRQLIKYLKWLDNIQSKIKKATLYPKIVTFFAFMAVFILMKMVVPQITEFLVNMDLDLPAYTVALIATSDFVEEYWIHIIVGFLGVIFFIKLLRRMSRGITYRLDMIMLGVPVIGPLVRKINVARFSQTFAALFNSGIDIIQGLRIARATVTNLVLEEALEDVEEQVKNGMPMSESFNVSGEFPSMVVRMIKVGEESGNLTKVLDQVSEFYTNDVNEAIEAMTEMILPFLTAVLGGILFWIALGVFGPIYANFGEMDF
jgi:type IV pilus assembly protein PilC